MARPYESDAEMFRLIRVELFTAVVGDVLDGLGFLHQFLPPRFRPVREDAVLIGRAMPVLEADVFPGAGAGARPALMDKPFGLMLEALDDLKAGEVYVAAGGSPRYAMWGELMSTRAHALGSAGALVDGAARDIAAIRALGFPVFCTGFYAQDQGPRGKVLDFRTTIEIGAIPIAPGSLIFADLEGALVIPRDAEEEAIRLALEKARGEKAVLKAIQGGMSACEAFKTFGIM